MFAQRLHFPQCVPLIHVHQNVIGAELIFPWTRDPLEAEVIVDVLQGLQTLSQVFIVELWGEIVMTFFTQSLGTNDVEPGRQNSKHF